MAVKEFISELLDGLSIERQFGYPLILFFALAFALPQLGDF